MSYNVDINGVTKRFGDFVAVDNITFSIDEGQLFTLLGPSGCGKTTLLRMIAGFNPIDEGTIAFGDKTINHIPANKRNIGMVFQNYAIFPHLTVFENVAYGLKARRLDKAIIEKKTLDALELVKISELKDRSPQQLSGGQQQRVALARAIVIEPSVLLMDEPLSNLDAKLRVEMRVIINKLQKQLGITTVYVTHDQEEALSIADMIGVMNKGKIQQIDTPENIYKYPANTFVANFIGTSNFLDGQLLNDGGKKILKFEHMTKETKLTTSYEGAVKISLRPEQLYLGEVSADKVLGTIGMSVFLGDYTVYEIELADGSVITANEYTKDSPIIRKEGEKVGLDFDIDIINIYAGEKEERLI